MAISEHSGRPKRAPLSPQHEFFCGMDSGDVDGAFGGKHTITVGWRVRGAVRVDALHRALDDVVRRHEMLRTLIPRGPEIRYQEVREPSPVRLVVRDLDADPRARDVRAEELINEVETTPRDVNELPHLRAVLGRFDAHDWVLVLTVHHIAADGWSMGVIIRDLTARYAAAIGADAPELPTVRQYGDYARDQKDQLDSARMAAARAYWREKLDGAAILGVPTDRPRSDGMASRYATHRFLLDRELTAATLRVANALRSSAFMVFLAAYTVLLRNRLGVADVVVPTFSSSRGEQRFHDSVGPFLNFLPLRANLAGCRNFRQVVGRVRATCVEAYTHDIPFAEIEPEHPALMSAFAETDRDVIAFEVLQFPATLAEEPIGGLRLSEIRRRLVSQPVSSDIPDGALWALDVLPTGETVGSVKFNLALFDYDTMVAMVSDYERLLRELAGAPEAPLPAAASFDGGLISP